MLTIGQILVKMLRSSIDYELTCGHHERAKVLRQSLARVMSQYNL